MGDKKESKENESEIPALTDNVGISSINYQFPTHFPSQNLRNYFNDPSERTWQKPFSFIVAADPQFGFIERNIRPRSNPRWDEEIALTSAAVKCINGMRPKPRFLVICGDMLDSPPISPEELKLREEQRSDFLRVLKNLDPEIPLVCVCGNHDIGDDPSLESYNVYKTDFGPDFFSFWVGGVKFCVVNSQLFKKPENLPEIQLQHKQFLNTISDKDAVHLVVFQHIPFFVRHAEEENISWLNIDKPLRYNLLDDFCDKGVNYVFAGHYHRNGGGRYKNFEQVVTSALGGTFGEDPSGFRLCTVTKDAIHHTYIPLSMDSSFTQEGAAAPPSA